MSWRMKQVKSECLAHPLIQQAELRVEVRAKRVLAREQAACLLALQSIP